MIGMWQIVDLFNIAREEYYGRFVVESEQGMASLMRMARWWDEVSE